jgi:Ca2+-binding RTX toxin-like protein
LCLPRPSCNSGFDNFQYCLHYCGHRYLMGGSGNDNLIGGAVSEIIEGGTGNDSLQGGGDNDTLDGGSGINTAIYAGNRADYDINFQGNATWQIIHRNNGVEGVDTVSNIQNLQFADQTVVLDDYSNTQDSTALLSTFGHIITGAAQYGGDSDWFQFDFGKLGIGKSLHITLEGGGGSQRVGIFDTDGNQLYFKNAAGQDVVWLYGGQNVLIPDRWGPNAEGGIFIGGKGWVQLYADSPQSTGTQYQLTIARYLEGTVNADTLATDGKYDEINGLAGDDTLTGGELSDRLLGGAGNDTLIGNGGDDYLQGGEGQNLVQGGLGNDTLDISARSIVLDTLEGGDGTDTLQISSGVNLAGASISQIETITSTNGGTFTFSPTQLGAWGVTQLNNLELGLAAPGTLDASLFSGSFNLVGSTGDDVLKGGSGNNVIRALSGHANIDAGAGDDTILYQAATGEYQGPDGPRNNFLSSDAATRSYTLQGVIAGGNGNDALEFYIPSWWQHPWSGNYVRYESSYSLNISQAALSGIEILRITNDWSSTSAPAYITMTAAQLAGFNQLVNIRGVQLVGGGVVDLAAFTAKGGVNLTYGDTLGYTLLGSTTNDVLTDTLGNDQIQGGLGNDQLTTQAGTDTVAGGDGNDTLIVSGKTAVLDSLDGGSGIDTLRIAGANVDLSGATITNIEAIEVSAQSISMTAQQWQDYGSKLTRVAGAATDYILTVTNAGTSSLAVDSTYVGLTGTAGDDVLIGNDGNNILVGGAGNDQLIGNAGDDRLVTSSGIDTLNGGAGNDTLVITDKILVNDQLIGGAGTDTLQVSDGQDLTGASLEGIEILKGTGTVTLTATQLTAFTTIDGLRVQLAGDVSQFTLGSTLLVNGASILLPLADPTVTMTAGILGSKGDDVITGSTGADVIYGGRGSDVIDGGAGADVLIGGSGVDTLIGGTGDDLFRIEASELTGANYSDIIDGGLGSDTLELNFGTGFYQFSSGAISNIERLVVNNPNNSFMPTVALTADNWNALTSFIS